MVEAVAANPTNRNSSTSVGGGNIGGYNSMGMTETNYLLNTRDQENNSSNGSGRRRIPPRGSRNNSPNFIDQHNIIVIDEKNIVNRRRQN